MREHAPWALTQSGFKAVISTSFADIFKGNSLKNGLLPHFVVPPDIHARLLHSPGAILKIDLATQTLTMPDGTGVNKYLTMPPQNNRLVEGHDELGYILTQDAAISASRSAARRINQYFGVTQSSFVATLRGCSHSGAAPHRYKSAPQENTNGRNDPRN